MFPQQVSPQAAGTTSVIATHASSASAPDSPISARHVARGAFVGGTEKSGKRMHAQHLRVIPDSEKGSSVAGQWSPINNKSKNR